VKYGQSFPDHIAIIMDGNGRWAKNKNKPRTYGHIKGASVAIDTVLYAKKLGIKYLTLFAFSTENWNRPSEEVSFLFALLQEHLKKEAEKIKENGICFKTIGNLATLPDSLVKLINSLSSMTETCNDMVFTLAISYGGKQEIEEAAEKYKNSKPGIKFKDCIQSSFLPDPDLLIRTGGEKRISNFLLYSIAYTELYFLDKYWPDFSERDFKDAIKEYKARKRKFGNLI